MDKNGTITEKSLKLKDKNAQCLFQNKWVK